MKNKVITIAVLATALLSIQAVTLSLSGVLDLGMLHNYANQHIPDYVFSEEVHDREITDELATLGRVLFYDKELSLTSKVSCASCHKQEFAFGDTLVASPGFDDKLTERHSTRLVNLNFSHMPEVFWDRRAGHLDSLPVMVLTNSIEMGFSGTDGQPPVDSLMRRLDDINYYETLFEQAYGDKSITTEKVNLALTQFVRSIVSYDSKYDVGRSLVDSNTVDFPNFTELENKGKRLFQSPFGDELIIPMVTGVQGPQGPQGPVGGGGWGGGGVTFETRVHPEWTSKIQGKMGCADCHGIDNFTTRETSLTGNNGIISVIDHPTEIDTTVKRSPSLRDLFNPAGIEVGPYMHDGSLATLEDVMEHYATIGFPEEKTIGLHSSLDVIEPGGSYTGPASGAAGPAGPGGWGGGGSVVITTHTLPPRIDEKGTQALIAFLKTLSGSNIYTDEKWSDPFSENGELTITNDCPQVMGEESVTICAGEVYKGHHTTGTFEIRERQLNGCDSVTMLHLTVNESPEISITTDVCDGETFMGYDESHDLAELKWDDDTRRNLYTIATTTMLPSNTGCDTIVHLDLKFLTKISAYNSYTICDGANVDGHYTEGLHVDTLASIKSGCDSINSINLNIIEAPTFNESHLICEGESVYGHSVTGVHKDTLIAASGCYTFRYVDLTVQTSPSTQRTEVICEGETVEGYTQTGTYSDVYVAANGCDSTRILDLTVNPKTYSLHEVDICEGESFLGYSAEGYYEDIFVNADGCDSTRQIALTILDHSESFYTEAICEGESVEGYTIAGTYIDVFQNAVGCDSTRHLAVEILKHSESMDVVAICAGEEYWGHSEAGLHVDMLTNVAGCDSSRYLELAVLDHSESYEEIHLCPGEDFEGYVEGDHTEVLVNAVGCDSLRYISIVNIPVNDAVCTPNHDDNPRRMSESDYLSTYPNPVEDIFTLRITKPERLGAKLRIYDMTNSLLLQETITQETTTFDFSNYSSGLYLIYLEDGKNLFMEKVLKI